MQDHSPSDPLDLLDLKRLLRTSARSRRATMALEPRALADAYRNFIPRAPRRLRPYLSLTRSGVLSTTGPSGRREEHLAIALRNAGMLQVAGGRTIEIADYQMPLKAVRADADIGKVDLVGVCAEGHIVVIELKVAGNAEDRRIGLVEGLIYAAAIDANVGRIADELEAALERPVRRERPDIIVAAPPTFWAARAEPSLDEMQRLAAGLSDALDAFVELMSLEDGALASYGLLGSRPTLAGRPFLTGLAGTAA